MPTPFVDSQLAARLEDAQAWRAFHYAQASHARTNDSKAAYITVAGAPVIYGGAGIPVNRAIGLGMHGPVSLDDLQTVQNFYDERHADTVIDVCPLADPSLLGQMTNYGNPGRGYHVRNWMSMLFLPLPIAPTPINPELRVTRATPDEADLWLATSARGFDGGEHVADTTRKVLTPNFFAANAHCYFAWRGETPIATGGMYLHHGVAELGGASTLMAHRNQGAQNALIHQRLHDAHALGCDLAAVLTEPGSASQRNMQRRGFQLAYTRAICVRPYTAAAA